LLIELTATVIENLMVASDKGDGNVLGFVCSFTCVHIDNTESCEMDLT